MSTIVSVVGNSNSGKTTLIEKLIVELKSRGYRVATVKNTSGDLTFDKPGKDSWRHIQAGSEATVISSPREVVLIKPVKSSNTLDEIAKLFGEDYDVILAEGFKQGKAPKIAVHRQENGPLPKNLKQLIAIATDESLNTKTSQFALDDVKGIVALLEKDFIPPQGERLSLYVNNTPLTLTAFPREFISRLLVAMVSSLKGASKVKSLELFLRKKG